MNVHSTLYKIVKILFNVDISGEIHQYGVYTKCFKLLDLKFDCIDDLPNDEVKSKVDLLNEVHSRICLNMAVKLLKEGEDKNLVKFYKELPCIRFVSASNHIKMLYVSQTQRIVDDFDRRMSNGICVSLEEYNYFKEVLKKEKKIVKLKQQKLNRYIIL